jgi:hypothetical protein
VTIDNETLEMIKRRFGEEFVAKINENLDIKAAEVVRKDVKGGKRRPRVDGK